MKRQLLPEGLWERVRPLLPRPEAGPRRGRPRKSDRAALIGILFVLKTGIDWEDLPAEVFRVSESTCWRRLEQWTRAGVFRRLQHKLLDELGIRRRIDWSRAVLDSSSIRAKKGDSRQAPTPRTERRRGPNTM
jgi:transposase